MKMIDLDKPLSEYEFKEEPAGDGQDTIFRLKLNCIGQITVLDRMTGYGGGLRDIETGFIDNDGEFWLASGNFDIRNNPDININEAITIIKRNANTCIG